jgi:DNA-binding transcriptional LysR family regulator
MTAACRAAGFTPNVRHETSEWQLIVSLVAAGFGVALAPASVRWMPRRGVRYLVIPESEPVAQLDLVFSASPSPVVERFADIAAQVGFERTRST